MSVLRTLAPAKVNLGLFVGPLRADGRHELATVMQAISLADELTLQAAPPGATGDEVVCPGVPAQDNLAARALRAFRSQTGWSSPPLRLTIAKRIPLAAGLAGGSADAAAALRLAAGMSGLGERRLHAIAAQLGADVPAQVEPGRWLAGGAGERLERLPAPRDPLGLLVLALDAELSTAAVYARADRLGAGRTRAELQERARLLTTALADGAALPDPNLLHNDLQRAAVALCPAIDGALEQARGAGADVAIVSGSGPTVVGLFAGADGPRRAADAAAQLAGRVPAPACATPVQGSFAAVTAADAAPQRP